MGIRLQGDATIPALNNVVQNCTVGAPYTGVVTPDIGSSTLTVSPTGLFANNVQDVKIRYNTVRNIGSATNPARGIWMNLVQGQNNEMHNNTVSGVRSFSTATNSVNARGMEANLATTGTHTCYVYNNMITDITGMFTGTTTALRMISGLLVGNSGGLATQTYNVDHNSIWIRWQRRSQCFQHVLRYGR